MTTTESKTDLRALVLKVAAESDTPDPGVIAHKVLALIPDEDLRQALAHTLRQFVRLTVRPMAKVPESVAPTKTAPEPVTDDRPANWSAKVESIRAGWRQHLQDPVHVGHSEWKFWKDCSAQDFYAAAEERMLIAKSTRAAADKFRAAGDLLSRHGVARWADLPLDVQEKAITDLVAA